jgi:hypothetical protein
LLFALLAPCESIKTLQSIQKFSFVLDFAELLSLIILLKKLFELHWEMIMLQSQYSSLKQKISNFFLLRISYIMFTRDIFILYFGHNIVISQCNWKIFFIKRISEESSAKSHKKENFWILFNFLFECLWNYSPIFWQKKYIEKTISKVYVFSLINVFYY